MISPISCSVKLGRAGRGDLNGRWATVHVFGRRLGLGATSRGRLAMRAGVGVGTGVVVVAVVLVAVDGGSRTPVSFVVGLKSLIPGRSPYSKIV